MHRDASQFTCTADCLRAQITLMTLCWASLPFLSFCLFWSRHSQLSNVLSKHAALQCQGLAAIYGAEEMPSVVTDMKQMCWLRENTVQQKKMREEETKA